jgi:hypothetical protein
MTRNTLGALVALAVLHTPAVAEPTRSGFMIGASMGGGGANACRDCDASGGPAAELHIGAWLTPQFALSYEAWIFLGDTTKLDNMTSQGFGLVTATLHVAPRWYVKGGLGLALYEKTHAITDPLLGMDTSVELKGFGLGTGAGYELYQSTGSFVVDVSGRLAVSMFPGHGAGVMGGVALGVSWN